MKSGVVRKRKTKKETKCENSVGKKLNERKVNRTEQEKKEGESAMICV